MKENTLTKMVHYATILPVILIFLGAFKLIIYYKVFGLSIGHYLKVQDILTLFFDDAFYYMIYGLGLYVLFVLVYSQSMGAYNREKALEHYKTIGFIERMKKQPKSIYFAAVLCVILYVLSIFLERFANNRIDILFTFIYFAFLPVLQVEFERKYLEINGEKNLMFLHNVILYTTIFMYIFYQHTKTEIQSVKNFKFYGTTIITEKASFISDSTNNYIGKTMDYYFFNNANDNSNVIVPAEDVTKVIIKKKK